jgi:hypothetical protein
MSFKTAPRLLFVKIFRVDLEGRKCSVNVA